MNLITDHWLPVFRKDGTRDKIAPWQITNGIESDKPIVEIDAPRADFKGALYQFFIGLLQTIFAPDDEDDWLEFWENPPNEEMLRDALFEVKEAFEIDSDGPAFMQDFQLVDFEEKDVNALLIEAPGTNTIMENRDHFIKRGKVEKIGPYWAAISLFTLQINAPSGGSGHRTSLRGGGPLTTLVLPDEAGWRKPFWNKIWLNILTVDELAFLKCDLSLKNKAAIFPWLAPTRTSENHGGSDTYPEHVHPYQMYWAMPRRIRLICSSKSGHCDLSGEYCEKLVCTFRTKNYGINYSGSWHHPLTPYTDDPQKGSIPLKPQPGGICYRHWLCIALQDSINHRQPARVVEVYLNSRFELIEGDYQPRVWCFGYDMDNMKARCWYESTMPIFPVPQHKRDDIQEYVTEMIDAASGVLYNLKSSLKVAWFSRTKDAKGDFSFIDTEFWNRTETDFYRLLAILIRDPSNEENIHDIFKRWHSILRNQAESLFDQLFLSSEYGDGNIKRVVKARRNLVHWLRNSKQMKKLTA
ncbi:MAG TPA: type I-E CRISPR-associated protein Cse1/CasA [Deltaproteobacteria bacterium]|nr:MAG: type I-E CRISPR-associated protein Cse1/CasA [Desulfobacterium sp. 4572_20]RLB95806.1 MAG: type I-E CRISPR-associated protein Cse1/CasA [Deltaproteobacteria bacterium]HDG96799.1 type I-E CRISPR-associated protein Cse1/CasA [Desulfobacterales bacterium]HDH98344.1 type I-E CRISPR-associated protein Cse1/CasA [Deltaproteobacteria bacterium]